MAWRDNKNANQRARNAARRAKGLCLQCPMPSGRFARCLFCRVEFATKARECYDKRRRRKFRRVLNERARHRYAAMKETAA